MSQDLTLEDRIIGRKDSIINPNSVSVVGTGTTLAGMITVYTTEIMSTFAIMNDDNALIGNSIGFGLAVLGYALDKVDGYVAKHYNISTKEGAIIDPLCDKIRNKVMGTGMIAHQVATNLNTGLILPILVSGANFALDTKSQLKRGPIKEQFKMLYNAFVNPAETKLDKSEKSTTRANSYGKWKTTLQGVVNCSYLGLVAFDDQLRGTFERMGLNSQEIIDSTINYGLGGLLGASAVLAYAGIRKRS